MSLSASAAARQLPDLPIVRLDAPAEQAHVPSLPAVRLADAGRSTDLDGNRAVSLTFAQPLAVRDVLLLLFRDTAFSIVFEPGAAGTFVGELGNLTLRQALEAVLVPAGLDYDVRGPVVRVFPRRPQTRLFEVSHVDVRRGFQRRMRSLGAPDDGAVAAELSAGRESDFFATLGEGVRALLSPGGRMHVDRNAGVVQVTDFADRLDQVGIYIEAVTVRATRQVRLHARVLEVTLSGQSSIDWRTVATRAGVSVGSGAGIKVADFDAFVQAIAAFGAVRVVASPYVLAMNNEPAVMRVGSQCAVLSATSSGGAAPGCQGGADRAAGWTLTITSQIGADGIVHMSVSPTFAEPVRAAAGGMAMSIVESDTAMRVQGGETVVVSGFLRDVPQNGNGVARKELLILLTPTVVNPGSAPVAGAQ